MSGVTIHALAAALAVATAAGCVGAITDGSDPPVGGDDDDDDGVGPGGGDDDDGSGVGDDDDGSGGDDDGGGTYEPCTECADDLFPDMPSSGVVPVTLVPGDTVALGDATLVAFGAPFPPDTITDVSDIRVTDAGGTELAAHVEELVRWRSLAEPAAAGSVRAALVYLEVTFATRDPITVDLHYGVARTAELGDQPDPTTTWVSIASGVDPTEYPAADGVREPSVYATFPADWLGQCLIRTRTSPADADPAWGWYDASFVGSATTATNDVDPRVTDLIDYTGDAEPWLFDRTLTLFGVYARTGDVRWLRHAHRSAQYYRAHITADGYFDLKDGDLKYSYGQALLADLILTGDRSLVDPIERIAAAGTEWDEVYTTDTNFWTERHQTYALLAALSAFEATGAAAHATRARAVADASFDHALSPPGGWAPEGCMLHTMLSHEGAGVEEPICSPWMSALFADAAWRYYLHSRDDRALEFLANLGDFVAARGLYDGSGESLEYTLPWYLASSHYQWTDDGAWGDWEHTCDVAGLVARGAWARRALGGDPSSLRAATEELLVGCEMLLDNWHRPAGPESGQSEWRLSPSRKFNWWFGTTSDLPWLIQSME
jgi:hypothetical protein